MTTTSVDTSATRTLPGGSARPYAGYGALLRLALRRDRIKLPAWVLGITFFTGYFANALQVAYPDQADLDAIMGFMDSPAGIVMSGPGFGFDNPTHAITFAGGYGIWLMIPTAFMSILLVGRHTRFEEEAGRLELIRAGVVGRQAPLAVAGTLAVAANLLLFLLTTVLVGAAYDYPGGALFAASLVMVGLVFAGVALVSAQLAEHSRSATALASLAVGAAVVIRGAGDVLKDGGSWLSWLSPIAWAQQTRVFYDGRWWPLALGLVAAVATWLIGTRLLATRDVGAGILPTRLGHPRAAGWLSSPWAVAFRLERGAILGWSLAVLVLGVLYGALTDSIATSMADTENQILLDAMGGDPSRMVDGYLATDAFFNAFIAACYVLVAAHRLVKEEREGRAEVALAARVSRQVWLLATVMVSLLGGLIVLIAAGLGMGIGTAASTGDVAYLGTMLNAHLVYLPALAVFLSLAALGFAFRPGWLNLAWIPAVYAIVASYLGIILDLPQWALNMSPLEHVAMAPLETQAAIPLVWLSVIAVALTAGAAVRFRSRDLTSG